MGAKAISLDNVAYRVFVTRERDGFRAFWFCPHHDCYGAFRSDQLFDDREAATEHAMDAAARHESEVHQADVDLFAETGSQVVPTEKRSLGN